jgi:hypothetical protein
MSAELEAALLAVNAQLKGLSGTRRADLSQAAALIYDAMAGTSDTLLQDFKSFTEEMLAKGIETRADAVVAGGIAIRKGIGPLETLLDGARLLRAVEQALVEDSRYIESPHGADLEDAWRTADGKFYLVPRVTALHKIDGKPFLRRALLHFRVLPTRIGNFRVRLHRVPAVASGVVARQERSGQERGYGAALFPALSIATGTPQAGEFLVESLSGIDAHALLEGHIADGKADNCVAIVWAELTMPDAHVAMLRTILADTALDGPRPCHLMVAGSWHRLVAGQMRNLCIVLDGEGETICEVAKWAKFEWQGLTEGIVPGEEIHVLIGEAGATVIAICRDFLQETGDIPYRNLNVDVAIVPSMMAAFDDFDTIAGHAATAQTMRVRFGTRTLVVAQPAAPGPGAEVGRVLDFPAKPLHDVSGQPVDGPWRLCVLASV